MVQYAHYISIRLEEKYSLDHVIPVLKPSSALSLHLTQSENQRYYHGCPVPQALASHCLSEFLFCYSCLCSAPYSRSTGTLECAQQAPILESLHRLFPLSGMIFPHLANFFPLLLHCSNLINTTNFLYFAFLTSLFLLCFFFFPQHTSPSNILFNFVTMLIISFQIVNSLKAGSWFLFTHVSPQTQNSTYPQKLLKKQLLNK